MGEEVKETQVVETAEENNEETEKEVTETEEKEEKTFTQAEVDALIKERLKRVKKEAKKEEKTLDEPVQKNESYAEDIAELKALQLENLALRHGVSETHLPYISKLVATQEGSLSERFSKVLEDFPVFKENKKDDGTTKVLKAAITKANQAKPAMTKEDIMAISDGAERRKAIRENSHLFNY